MDKVVPFPKKGNFYQVGIAIYGFVHASNEESALVQFLDTLELPDEVEVGETVCIDPVPDGGEA